MVHGHKRCWIALLGAALLSGGCHSSAVETAARPPAPAAPATAPVANAGETPTPKAAEPTPAAPAAAAAAAPNTVAQHPFTPPFPNRLEPFEPPKRAQSSVRKEDAGAAVELKGFINVDGPKVVLSIDGVIATLPAGGEKYGVQVLSIDPPSVVLQRGKTRWPAKLE